MEITGKHIKILASLKTIKELKTESDKVILVLECVRDGYMKFGTMSEKENFIVDEINYYIKELKKSLH